MSYGPCGGVATDGGCEVDGHACEFVSATLTLLGPPRSAPAARLNPRAAALAARLAQGGAVIADFPGAALDSASLRECAQALQGVDAVLLGDSPHARVQFPPAYRAGLIERQGLTAWVGLNARDRNRVALEAELAALTDLQVAAVHCITGDHPAVGGRPDAAAVFDLDSIELTALASGRGFSVSVGESPSAPPQVRRPERLLTKERAGAGVCFVNHCGGVDDVAAFIRAARALGATTKMIACVPLVCDRGSAAELASFRGPAIAARDLDRILGAEDPRATGITIAVDTGRRLLDTGLLAGVNLSGGPTPGQELAYAEAQAQAAEAILR
jgi:5,10-methylenetetrahydrofolate reductase